MFKRSWPQWVSSSAPAIVGATLPIWVFTPQRFGLAGSLALNGA